MRQELTGFRNTDTRIDFQFCLKNKTKNECSKLDQSNSEK